MKDLGKYNTFGKLIVHFLVVYTPDHKEGH